jgi:hypothetical protein
MTKASEWIPVGALGDAFHPDSNVLPPITDLNGRTIRLHFENGWVIVHAFIDDERLSWRVLEGKAGAREGHEHYTATRPRQDIYFVDFIKSGERPTSVSLVLDFARGVFLAVIGELPEPAEVLTPFLTRIALGDELTAVTAVFLRGCIDVAPTTNDLLPQTTRELLGKRIEYRYSPFELYEHIYLNDRLFTWRCIEGSERGLADTDACHHFRIDDGLYLFAWREKIVPTLGVILIDVAAMKTTGKITGYESNDFGAVRNFRIGAHARLISTVPVV